MGKVYYIGEGKDPLGIYPNITELPRGGAPFHPRCTKRYVAFVPGLATKAQTDAALPTLETTALHGMDSTAAQRTYLKNHPEVAEKIRQKAREQAEEKANKTTKTEAKRATTVNENQTLANAGLPRLPRNAPATTARSIPDQIASPQGKLEADVTGVTSQGARVYIERIVREHGDLLPQKATIKVTDSTPEQVNEQRRAGAALSYDPVSRNIVATTDNVDWEAADRIIVDAADRHEISTDHPAYILFQETAHVLHHSQTSDLEFLSAMRQIFEGKQNNTLRRRIVAEVSERAVFSEAEFVAEVFSGLCSGKKYGEFIMQLYNNLKGPQP